MNIYSVEWYLYKVRIYFQSEGLVLKKVSRFYKEYMREQAENYSPDNIIYHSNGSVSFDLDILGLASKANSLEQWEPFMPKTLKSADTIEWTYYAGASSLICLALGLCFLVLGTAFLFYYSEIKPGKRKRKVANFLYIVACIVLICPILIFTLAVTLGSEDQAKTPIQPTGTSSIFPSWGMWVAVTGVLLSWLLPMLSFNWVRKGPELLHEGQKRVELLLAYAEAEQMERDCQKDKRMNMSSSGSSCSSSSSE